MTELDEQFKKDLKRLQNVLEGAKLDYATDAEDFLKQIVFKMCRFIRIYFELLHHLDVDLDTDIPNVLKDFELNELEQFKLDRNSFLQSLEVT